MDNISETLTKCFSLVFPKLDAKQIPRASAENVREWDSIAQVTLLGVIADEFRMDMDFEKFEGATSFQAFLERLHQIGNGA